MDVQSWKGCMRQAIVFVWDSTMRGISSFQRFSPSIKGFWCLEGGLGARF